VDVRPPLTAEGRSLHAVTHLAWLGVKMQETAFRVYTKDESGFGRFFDSNFSILDTAANKTTEND
jgi:citrate lyase synthetase